MKNEKPISAPGAPMSQQAFGLAGSSAELSTTSSEGFVPNSQKPIPSRLMTLLGGFLAIILVLTLVTAGTLIFGKTKISSHDVADQSQQSGQVLAAGDRFEDFELQINVPTLFGKPVTFLDSVTIEKELSVSGVASLSGGIVTNNANINAGTGTLTASNVVYGLIAGNNVSITGDPQNPTISAQLGDAGVTSFQGQVGAVTLTQGSGIGLDGLTVTNTGVLSVGGQTGSVTLGAGTGISVSGTTITNTDTGSSQNIFKSIIAGSTTIDASANDDSITFSAGSGITITGDAGSKTITITSSAGGLSGLTPNGVLYASSATTATTTTPGTTGTVLKGVTAGAPVFGAVSLSSDVTGLLPVANGGTGVSTTATNGQLLIGNGSGYSLATLTAGTGIGVTNGSGSISITNNGVVSVTGTANQIATTGATGAITLSLPQDIATTSTPTFASMTLTANTNQLTLGTGTTGVITMATLTSGRTYTFPDASGEICLSSGNCPGGGGGGVSGSGTTNYLARFTGTSAVGDSLLYDTGSKIGLGTTSPEGLFSVSGGASGQALVSLNETGDQNILVGSASGTTRFVFDRTGNLNLNGGGYQIGGTSVLTSNTLGSGVTTSSLTSVGALSSGSITSGFGTIATGNSITGTTLNGTTGINTGAGAGTQRIDASGNLSNIGNITASGTVTLSSLSTGVLLSNGSGVLSSSALNLSGGSSYITGTLPVGNGGTGLTAVGSAGSVTYSNGTTYGFTSVGTSGQVLSSTGAGAPTWIDASGVGTNYWQRNNGTLAPLNITDDLLVGGVSTAAATFQVTSAGNLRADGTVTFSGFGTGVLQSNGSGSISSSTLDISDTNYITGTLGTANGGTGLTTTATNGQLLIGNGAGYTLSTLSAGAGISVTNGAGSITIANTGVTSLSGTTNQVSVSAATGAVTLSLPQNIDTGATPTFSSLFLTSNTNQLTLGTSNTGTITMASLTGSRTYTLPDETGTFCLTSGNCAGVGGVGDIGAVGDVTSGDAFTASGTQGTSLYFYDADGRGQLTIADLTAVRTFTLPDASGEICLVEAGNCAGSGGGITGSGTSGQIAYFNGSGSITSESSGFAWDATNNRLGIGNDTPAGKLDVSGASVGKSLFILNETGDQNILTASASGTTVANLNRNGNLAINGTLSNLNFGTLTIDDHLALSAGKSFNISGTGNVLDSTTLGSSVVNSSLTSVGALASGSITTGFGTILTGNTIQGSNITASGTTGYTASGTGAGLTFSGTGNHDITASAGTLRIGAATLTGAITGNSQSITGLNNLSASGTITFGGLSTGVVQSNGSGVLSSAALNLAGGASYVTGTLPTGNGGTGLATTAGNGELLIGNGAGYTLSTLTAGTGIGITNGSGSITIANTGVTSLSGTANQVSVSGATGAVTLSLPQNINTTSSPTFNGLSLSSLTIGGDTISDFVGTGLQLNAGTLETTLGTSVDLTSEVTGTLPVANGGTGGTSVGSAGSVAYSNGSAYAFTAVGTSGQVLVSAGSGTPTWVDSASLGTNYWQRNAGALAPINTTDDLLLGATATSSALVRIGATSTADSFFNTGGNVAIGTTSPYAKLGVYGNIALRIAESSITSQKLSLTTDGNRDNAYIQLNKTSADAIRNGTVSIYTYQANAANLGFYQDEAGNVGIGTTTPTARLDVSGAASVSGSLSFRTGAGSIQTTANNNLTLGGNTTGNVIIDDQVYLGSLTTGVLVTTAGALSDVNGNLVLNDTVDIGSASTGLNVTTTGVLSDIDGNLSLNDNTDITGNLDVSGTFTSGTGDAFQINASGAIAAATGITSSGTVTFSGLSTGVVQSNVSGVLSSAALNLAGGASYITGTLPVGNGGTGATTFTSNGVVYGNGTGALQVTSAGTNGQLFLGVTSGAPAFATLSGDATINNAGVLTLANSGVTANTYGSASQVPVFTVDAKGRITSVTNTSIAINGNQVTSGTVGPTFGGTGLSSYTTGDLIYASATNTLSKRAIGTTGQIFSVAGGVPTWTTPSSLGINNYWQRAAGTLAPTNITDDLVLGATATSSALVKFGGTSGSTSYFNTGGNVGIGTNTPQSVIDITTQGSGNGARFYTPDRSRYVYFDYDGTNVSLLPGGGQTNVVIGNTYYSGEVDFGTNRFSNAVYANIGYLNFSNEAALSVRSSLGTSPAASISGTTANAALIVDNNGVGDIFTASKSGATRFVIKNNGNVGIGDTTPASLFTVGSGDLFQVNSSGAIAAATGITSSGTIQFSTFSTNGGILYTNGSGTVAQTTAGTAGECLQSQGGGTPTWGLCGGTGSYDNYWQLNAGAVSPFSNTADVLIGATSTASALTKFSGTSGGNSFISTGNVGIGNNSPTSRLEIGANNTTNELLRIRSQATAGIELIADTDNDGSETGSPYILFNQDNATNFATIGLSQANGLDAQGNGLTNAIANAFVINSGNELQLSAGSAIAATIASSGNVGIGTTSPTAVLDVAGAASVSGSLTFRTGTGTIQTTANNNLVLGGTTTGNVVIDDNLYLGSLTTGLNVTPAGVLSDVDGSAVVINDNIQVNGNAILDSAGTTRISLGSTTTLTNTTTTLSGTTTLTASSLSSFTTASTLSMASTSTLNLASNATINGGTAANNNLTLQGTTNATRTTSYVLLQPNGGNVGIGTSTPGDVLSISRNQNALTRMNISNTTSGTAAYAALSATNNLGTAEWGVGSSGITSTSLVAFDNRGYFYTDSSLDGLSLVSDGSGDLRFYTAGGATANERMRITNGGTVGINTTSPSSNAQLDVSGAVRTDSLDLRSGGTVGFNFYNDGTDRYISTDESFQWWHNSSGNALELYYAGSGTAGTAISYTQAMQLTSAGNVVFNGDGNSNDFIVEGDTDANLFYVDGSADRVGIGTNTPGAKLDVNGEVKATSWSGGGLTDCQDTAGTNNSVEKKLTYNASTKQFSCSTDGSSVLIRKSADESVISTATYQTDDELNFSVGANETWIFRYVVATNTFSSAGFKHRTTVPTGTTCDMNATGTNGSSNSTDYVGISCSGGIAWTWGSTGETIYEISGTMRTGGTAGTVQFEWTQTSATGINTTVYGGRSYLIAHKVNGADVAEAYYSKDFSVGPGDVVMTDGSLAAGVQKTTKEYDSRALGIVSTNPGVVLGDETKPEGKQVLLALNGRVPVKIASGSAAIQAGDLLTTSSEPGRAMKAIRPGQVIGKALESWTPESGKDTVLTFLNVSYGMPEVAMNADGNLSLQGMPMTSETLEYAYNQVTEKTATQVASHRAEMEAKLSDFTDQQASTSAQIDLLETSVGSLSAQLTSLSDRIASVEASVKDRFIDPGFANFTASSAAELDIDAIETDTLVVSDTLAVTGRTTLADVGITGKVTVGLLSIDGLDEDGSAAINSTGTLKLQSTGLFGLDIVNGAVKIDRLGNIETKGTLTAEKINIDTKDVAGASLGEGILKAGARTVYIETTAVSSESAIFLTPKTPISFPLSVTDQDTAEGFTVELPTPLTKDVRFNWWIVN